MKKLSLFLVALVMILVSCKPEIEKPTVVTKSVGEITQTTAKIVGQVTEDGGAEVAERGVCWNAEGTPTIMDFRIVEGAGVGSFTSNISDLVPNTQYYVRTYATNEAGTAYGEEKTFTTLEVIPEEPGDEPEEPGDEPEQPGDEPEEPGDEPEQPGDEPEEPGDEPEQPGDEPEEPGDEPEQPGDEPEQPGDEPEQPIGPTVVTAEISNITDISAVCGGKVVNAADNIPIITRGVCWSKNRNPTLSDNYTTNSAGYGSYVSNMTQLTKNTTYYVRAYATDARGTTSYGEEKTFTTLSIELNGHEYVDLGLPSGLKWATCNLGAYSAEEYGGYYMWGVINEAKSSNRNTVWKEDISGNPEYDAATANWGGSWRMPTKAEQEELLNNCNWTWKAINGINGYNIEGPNGNSIFLPAAGIKDVYGTSSYVGKCCYYWSSTPSDNNVSTSNYLYYSNDSYYNGINQYYRSDRLSIRPVIN